MTRPRPKLVGILNVTPDSFSDGGRYQNDIAAIDAGKRMVDHGADFIDVGGESTRPGAMPVALDEELRRTIDVVAALGKIGVQVSIDTRKPQVAREALAAGAAMVNDVTALEDPEMREVCARYGCLVCLMHMRGEPRTMQEAPTYVDVVQEVREFLVFAATRAEQAGVSSDKIVIDPGIGFGKRLGHNLQLLRELPRFVETKYRVLIGVSRKSFIGRIEGEGGGTLGVEERLPGTLAAQVLAQASGVQMIRAHDVKEARQAIDVAHAILSGST